MVRKDDVVQAFALGLISFFFTALLFKLGYWMFSIEFPRSGEVALILSVLIGLTFSYAFAEAD